MDVEILWLSPCLIHSWVKSSNIWGEESQLLIPIIMEVLPVIPSLWVTLTLPTKCQSDASFLKMFVRDLVTETRNWFTQEAIRIQLQKYTFPDFTLHFYYNKNETLWCQSWSDEGHLQPFTTPYLVENHTIHLLLSSIHHVFSLLGLVYVLQSKILSLAVSGRKSFSEVLDR